MEILIDEQTDDKAHLIESINESVIMISEIDQAEAKPVERQATPYKKVVVSSELEIEGEKLLDDLPEESEHISAKDSISSA